MAGPPDDRRKLIGTDRTPGSVHDLYEGVDVKAFFADGSSSAILSSTVTRVDFYEVKGLFPTDQNSESGEIRETILSIRMPTVSWARLALNILQSLKKNDAAIKAHGLVQEKAIAEALDKVEL